MLDRNLAIDRHAQQLIRRDHLIHQLYLLVISLGLIIVVLAAMILFLTHTAEASSVCLTKSEARALWPRQHIYWYSSDHCWSNRRGGPPRGIKIDKIKETHAESLPAHVRDAGKADRVEPAPSAPRTVRIIPIEKPKEWKNDFEDYCCWPDLEATDAEQERERAFRILAERMKGLK